MYNDELSDYLRQQVQPLTKMRQFCDAADGSKKGLNRGDKYYWNVYSNVGTQGRRLDENNPIPETGFTIRQASLTVYEAGNSVPYTYKLNALAKHEITAIIDKTLKDDARKYFDIESYLQFKATALRAEPASGTSATSIDLQTTGTATTTNNLALGTGHVKAVVDTMKERSIPPFVADDYVWVSHPTTFRTLKNSLETLHQYTETGLAHIFNGEIGRYESSRFVEQNFIPKGGAFDSTTYDPWGGTADAWNNGLSSWAFCMGADTVTEALVVPEEIRLKLASDYGRSRGLAWYCLVGFGLVHTDATNCRIVMWDSACLLYTSDAADE